MSGKAAQKAEIETLQRQLNVVPGIDIDVDGILGPKTVGAILKTSRIELAAQADIHRRALAYEKRRLGLLIDRVTELERTSQPWWKCFEWSPLKTKA